MKKILITLIALLIYFTLQAQDTITYNGAFVVVNDVLVTYSPYVATGGGGVDSSGWVSQYKTIYYAMENPPSLDTADLQNDFVSEMVDSGYWARADLIYVFANKDSADSKLNWINPTTFKLVETGAGALTFTQYVGWTGDGTNYLKSDYWTNTDNTNFVLNSGSIGAYIRNNVETNGAAMGCFDGSQYVHISPRYPTNTLYARINTGSSISTAISNSVGFWMATRTASNATEAYRNGTSVISGAAASTSLPNSNVIVFGRQDGNYSTYQISFAIIMNGVTDTESSEINVIVERHMDALGIGIQ